MTSNHSRTETGSTNSSSDLGAAPKKRRRTFDSKIGNQRSALTDSSPAVTITSAITTDDTDKMSQILRNPSMTRIVKPNDETPKPNPDMTPPRPRNCTNIIQYLPMLTDVDKILKQGFMMKQGHVVRNWKGKLRFEIQLTISSMDNIDSSRSYVFYKTRGNCFFHIIMF